MWNNYICIVFIFVFACTKLDLTNDFDTNVFHYFKDVFWPDLNEYLPLCSQRQLQPGINILSHILIRCSLLTGSTALLGPTRVIAWTTPILA